MSEPSDFELPSDSEKLSHKYILDTLKKKYLATPPEIIEPVPAPVVAESASVGLPPLDLPADKRYFRINEVARIIGVETHVIRYWQSEFSTVRPEKSGSGHWVFSRRDVDTFRLIRHLLHVEKYSIRGAKKRLRDKKTKAGTPAVSPETLKWLARELKDLIQMARGTPA